MKVCRLLTTVIVGVLILNSCSNDKTESKTGATLKDSTKETFSLKALVEEQKHLPDSAMVLLHSQHHSHKVLGGGSLAGPFKTPGMKHYSDHAVPLEDLPVIFPGPGEYVHVMEGQRHGYKNLTIGITETFPGGAPPMHTHEGEESHVLLEGDILYALGDTLFTMKAPYVVNIPPMVPHAFKNIGKKTANLVVIFPTNVWKYDVVDYFPFKNDTTKSVTRFTKFKNKQIAMKN
jgi:quercetin dioxygenase-like cupin family protein